MPLNLKQAREAQEKAKEEGKMSDVSWLSGYMAAMIDWDAGSVSKDSMIDEKA